MHAKVFVVSVFRGVVEVVGGLGGYLGMIGGLLTLLSTLVLSWDWGLVGSTQGGVYKLQHLQVPVMASL